jgi:diguanylate cyclase (GGDEF)-like protein
VLCRYGGEEFVAVLAGVDEGGARVIAERLREQLHQVSVPHASGRIGVTASFGVAAVRAPDCPPATTLLLAADRAVYEAKRLGRDRVCVAEPVSRPRGENASYG